jgi:hypothetical protein
MQSYTNNKGQIIHNECNKEVKLPLQLAMEVYGDEIFEKGKNYNDDEVYGSEILNEKCFFCFIIHSVSTHKTHFIARGSCSTEPHATSLSNCG